VLMSYGPERERWFAFRSERLRVFMEAWLDAHAMVPVARPVWPSEAPAPSPESHPISQEALAGRRGRSAETLRKQLAELAETLGARDLEKVTAFAEFVKARRAARSYAHRHDAEASGDRESRELSKEAEPEKTEDSGEKSGEEEPTPSSRKRTASSR
jgi:hypothetical protein